MIPGQVPTDDGRDDIPATALETALKLLEMDLWPVVITPHDPDDPQAGKRPIGERWGAERPTETTLREVFARYPNAGLGIRLGPEGGVIDLDCDGPEARETLLRMLGGEVIETLGWDSARGRHYLLRWDDRLAKYGFSVDEKNPNYPGVGLRFGAAGKQFQSVCPPSPTTRSMADGRIVAGPPRRWNGCWTIADIPEGLFADLDRHAVEPTQERRKAAVFPIGGASSASASHEPWAMKALSDETSLLRLASEGDRNNQLNRSAFALGQIVGAGALDESLVASVLRETARQLGLGERETVATLASGLRDGMAQPRDLSGVGSTPLTPLTPKGRGKSKGVQGVNGVKGVMGVNGVGPTLEDDEHPVIIRTWPSPPDDAVWYGPAGRLAQAVDPFTEADPIGVLVQTLVAFGNMIGRQPFFQVGATRHYTNLFACTAGPTAMGRKGTAWDIVKMAMSYCDPDWVLTRVTGGLVSGEGLIWEVRDKVEVEEEIRERGQDPRRELVLKDAGVDDKRLLAVETEMGGLLKILTREGNTLSALIRQCWDSGMLRSMAKNNPNRATDAHVSIVGHITEHEVTNYLTRMDAANGFANRFLWVAVRQSKYLPDGSAIPHEPVRPILDLLKQAAKWAFPVRIDRDPEARDLWYEVYSGLCRGKPGLLGALTSRGIAQVMRLAVIYAVLDQSTKVRRIHLEAALALWGYCERSAAYIFGEALGDKDADHLLSALRSCPVGLSRSQIRSEVFRRNRSSDEISRILGRLLENNLVRYEVEKTEGRDRTTWFAIEGATPLTPQTPLTPMTPQTPKGEADRLREPGEDDDDPTPLTPLTPEGPPEPGSDNQ
jgi:hypothetical protein